MQFEDNNQANGLGVQEEMIFRNQTDLAYLKRNKKNAVMWACADARYNFLEKYVHLVQNWIENLAPDIADILLNNGADLSNFNFPSENDFTTEILRKHTEQQKNIKLKIASGILEITNMLQKKGILLTKPDIVTIMNVFFKNQLFHSKHNFDKSLITNDLTIQSKFSMLSNGISFHDYIHLNKRKAFRTLQYIRYYEFACKFTGWKFYPAQFEPEFTLHICEKMARPFFESYGKKTFVQLIKHFLPDEMIDMILDYYLNKDFRNIYLSTE
ncbi:hypothetical protein TKK_0007174 [Trichogramma kaykai]